MYQLLAFQISNIKSNQPWSEADQLTPLLNQDPNIRISALQTIIDGFDSKAKGISMNYETLVPFYQGMVANFTDNIAVGLYNVIAKNKDYFYQYYLLNEEEHVKNQLMDDIRTFKESTNLPDELVVCLFRMNQILHSVLTGEYSIANEIPAFKLFINDVLLPNSNFDTLISNIIYKNVSSAEIISRILNKLVSIVMRQYTQQIEMSNLYKYFYKYAV